MDRFAQSGGVAILTDKALELIDELPVDPAHKGRVRSIAEASRLVADASEHLPGALNAPEFALFLDMAEALARDVEVAGTGTSHFADDELLQVEIVKGPLSASLVGLVRELQGLAYVSGVKALPPVPVTASAQIFSLTRTELAEITKAAVRAMGQIERVVDGLRDDPIMLQQAWGMLLHMSYAIVHLSDCAAVNREIITHLTGKAATALFKIREQISDDDPRGVLTSFDSLAPALDLIVDCLHASTARQKQRESITVWRFLSRGRVRLDEEQVEEIIGCAGAGISDALGMRAAAAILREEWAGVT